MALNAPELEETDTNITKELTFSKQQLGTADGGESSILGLPWNKRADIISVIIPSKASTITKRGTLQKHAKIYDPLWLPQTLQEKLVYREMCQRKLGWDAPIENDPKQKWFRWEQSLPKQVNTPC